MYTSPRARTVRRAGNLPAETSSFVGRRDQLTAIRKKLAGARLVTLTGPVGVGKTRLALRAAAELARGFSGGTCLVELAEVSDPGAVPAGQALDLLTALVSKSLLIRESHPGAGGLVPAARDHARVRPAQAGRGGRGRSHLAALH